MPFANSSIPFRRYLLTALGLVLVVSLYCTQEETTAEDGASFMAPPTAPAPTSPTSPTTTPPQAHALEGTTSDSMETTQLKPNTILKDYLAKADGSYTWKKIGGGKIHGTEYAELILVSQTWRDIVWKHRMFILKPSTVTDSKQAVLVIGGGRWTKQDDKEKPTTRFPGNTGVYVQIAEKLKTPVAVLLNVPKQPMFDGLVEDEIISLTFDKYLRTEDADWPLLLPMTKSAVRGMDAMQAFCKKEWKLDVEHFTVTGASKRGWTTWLTGAMDKRVNAIAPMVIDTLNMAPQMRHQIRSWGKFSDQIEDYTRRGIQQRMNTPIGKKLNQIVDPYVYRKKLTMPKLIINGTNDPYWPLDALNLYWDGLEGEKYIVYAPNNGHGLRDFPRILGGLMALNEQARGGKKMPALTWEFTDLKPNMKLKIQSKEQPKKVLLWTAKSKTRDFRESHWSSIELKTSVGSEKIAATSDAPMSSYTHTENAPKKGFSAFYIEAVFERDSVPVFLSTNVRILKAVRNKE